MSKFVFLVNDDGYRKYTYLAAKEAGASVPRIKSRLVRKLFEIHNAEPLNRFFELPLKWMWYSKVVNESNLFNDDEIYFILYESFHMSYSRKLIRHFKKRYKKSKFYYLFTNPASNYNLYRLNKIKDLLDGVFSFNKEDVKKYGYFLLEEEPFILPKQGKHKEISDVFFVGSDKGRLPILLSIYEKLSKDGLICDFWITGVSENNQKYKDVIHYNHPLSYEEVLKRDARSKCILEVLQDGKTYTSIRTLEAIQYHKKLLTMSTSVKDRWFYNPEIINVFQEASELSKDFIQKTIEDKEFEKISIGSFSGFEKKFLKMIKSGNVDKYVY